MERRRYIGPRGYTIHKDDFSSDELEMIKHDLTFLPNHVEGYGPPPKAFAVYGESKNKLFLPKFFGIQRFGPPQENKIDRYVEEINLDFKGDLREKQLIPVKNALQASEETGGGILTLPCGSGKCLGKDTPVMMYDGSIKMVQDIKTGDFLMGDDSKPRTVLSTCHGKEQMYKVVPRKGDSYIVNESHILSLLSSTDKIVDINVKDYLNLPKSDQESLYGYRVKVEFPEKEVALDPYIVGQQSYKNQDTIPSDYKCNSKKVRMKLLEGIIDANDGNEITTKNEQLLDDIIYLARSLGYNAYKSKLNSSYKTYIQDGVLTERIKIEKLNVDEYFGFEIDGNRRFLLGDFTVTHNTVIALYLIANLGVKALIVVAKEFLMEQWKERIHQFLPEAKVGILRQKKQEIEGSDIVIGMLQSISMCDYDINIYRPFGVVFYDEVHCVPSKVFSKALRTVQTRYHFGLSATPNRADGMTKVTKMFIGPVFYKPKRSAMKNPKNCQVLRVFFKELPKNRSYDEKRNRKGKPDIVKMITRLTECPYRTNLIANICHFFIHRDLRHILILSDRLQYLNDIEKAIKKIRHDGDPMKIGYYIGSCTSKQRKEAESCDLILASYSMAKEAMDIPILDTLFMVTPKGNQDVLKQCIGRVQRKPSYPAFRPPLVIDFVDDFSSFAKQAWRRRDYYKKNQYPIYELVHEEKVDVPQRLQEVIEQIVESDEIEVQADEFDEERDERDEVPTTLSGGSEKVEISDDLMAFINSTML